MAHRRRMNLVGMGALVFAAMLSPLASSAADAPVAAPVSAQVAAEAKAYREKGGKAFDEGNYQEAYEAFQKAIALQRTAGAMAFMASSLNALGRYDDALAMYEQVLREFPNASEATRKKVKGEMEALLAKVGTIDVSGDVPEGGRLFIDGRDVGTLPLSAPVRVVGGIHEVRAEKAGFDPIKVSADVTAGKPFVAKLVAKERQGRLEIREKHNWVLRVEIDGEDVGLSPISRRVAVGEHRIRLHGFMSPDALLACETPEAAVAMGARMESEEKVFTLGLFETQSVELSAEDMDASLHIESTPAGAALRIDGKDVGGAPWDGRLPLGEHAIEVRSKGYFVGKQRVVLERRRQRELSVALERVPEPPGFWTGRNVGTTAGLGLGLIGLGFFGVAGGLALGNASDLKAACVDGICPGGKQEQIDETRLLGNVALAGMIVGGVGIVAGASVWVFAAPKEKKRETRELAGMGLRVGVGGVAVEGRF